MASPSEAALKFAQEAFDAMNRETGRPALIHTWAESLDAFAAERVDAAVYRYECRVATHMMLGGATVQQVERCREYARALPLAPGAERE